MMKTVGGWLFQVISIMGMSFLLYTEMVADGVPTSDAALLSLLIAGLFTYSLIFLFFEALTLRDRKRAGLPLYDWPAVRERAQRWLPRTSAMAFALMLLWGFIHATGPERRVLVLSVITLVCLLTWAITESRREPDSRREA